MNSSVQTGPNNQFGGLKEDFTMVAYQPLILGMVTALPAKEVAMIGSVESARLRQNRFVMGDK